MSLHKCRLCGADLNRTFVDLGMSPLCESYVPAAQLDDPETFYPLHVRICESLPARAAARATCRARTSSPTTPTSPPTPTPGSSTPSGTPTTMIERLGLGPDSLVTEVASNDGYLLQHFVARRHPGARRRAGRERRRGRPGQGDPDRGRVPRPGDRRRARGAGTAGPTWSPATTSTPTCPTSAASPPGCARWSRTTGLVTLEFPHLLRLIERPPVRHDLPRALPVPVAADRVPGAGHGRADAWSTSTSSARTAARCGCTPGRPRRPASRRARVQGRARRRGGGRPAHGRRATTASPRRSRRSSATCSTS